MNISDHEDYPDSHLGRDRCRLTRPDYGVGSLEILWRILHPLFHLLPSDAERLHQHGRSEIRHSDRRPRMEEVFLSRRNVYLWCAGKL